MKKLVLLFLTTCFIFNIGFAADKADPNLRQNEDGSLSIIGLEKDAAVKVNQKIDGFKDVIVVNASKVKKNNPVSIDLTQFGKKEIYINFSCEMKIVESSGATSEVIWMINDFDAGMPKLVDEKVESGVWKTYKGELAIPLGENKSFYLSGAGVNKATSTIYLRNLDLKISGDGVGNTKVIPVNWVDAPSIKEAYKDYFDYFGFAINNSDLTAEPIQEGLSRHADAITMGNEFKPDFIFNWRRPSNLEDFIAEDGNVYQVPMGMPDFSRMRQILFYTQMLGLKLRGHVLVWHNQTPEWFFRENYNDKAPFVDAATMNARLEWYIKSVLSFVTEWEEKYNDGQHIIFAWDVVNEAIADGAGSQKWLRENSNWFNIYGDETFIINAFRYANKYTAPDVLLVYNDYNCYSAGKCNAICNLIDEIRSYPDARIDVIGMQSHVKLNYPSVTGYNSFEETVKKFLAKGVDVQITELDIANGSNKYSSVLLKAKYKEYFKMFLANRKTEGKNGITGITIWGLSDKGTWLNNLDEYKGHTQYPLLLDGDFNVKPCFYGVLEAAEDFSE